MWGLSEYQGLESNIFLVSGGAQEKGAKSEYYHATMLKNIGKKVEKLKSWSPLLKKGRIGDEMGREPVFGRLYRRIAVPPPSISTLCNLVILDNPGTKGL